MGGTTELSCRRAQKEQNVKKTKKFGAIYPGTFDPITFGHLDIIERAVKVFDSLIVAVAEDTGKSPYFTSVERAGLVMKVLGQRENVRVEIFQGLLVDFAYRNQTYVIIRGIRAISDFENEFQMAMMNRKLNPKIESVFLTPKEEYSFLSSRLAREVCSLGGSLKGLVPPLVEKELIARVKQRKQSLPTLQV
jgi:pantetheine-phosphate adenylyltransferase